MQKSKQLAAILFLSFSPLLLTAQAAEVCYTPEGAERKAVLDSLRTPVAAELKQSVEFVVKKLRVCWKGSPQWAFVDAVPQRPGGAAVDWESTGHIDCGHLVHGLLKQTTPGSGWSVVESVVCPSDVPWADWSNQYGAPQKLFE